MKLLDKDTVVSEIERRKTEAEHNCGGWKSYSEHVCDSCQVDKYEEFSEILDTLEVKEVNLDKEIRRYRMNNPIIGHREATLYDYMANAAKHFFELGLKAKYK